MPFITTFLYSQLFVSLPVPTKDFSGQTIIVTGANTGLGFEAARHFNRLNASLVIIAVRNTSKGDAAKKSILESTNRESSSIEVWELDLQSFESVQAFAARANQLKRLDALLENAGIMTKYFKMVAGYESTITTNVISTFLLALLILPKLRETSKIFNEQTRLTIVSSDLHYITKFNERKSEDIFDELNNEKTAAMGGERYGVSKLLEVFAVRELAALSKHHGDESTSPQVIINCLTPGACRSDFQRESTGVGRAIFTIVSYIIGRSTEVGSRALVASVVAGEESHGQFMMDCHVVPASDLVLSAEGEILQKKVWKQLTDRLEVIQPGITQNI